MTRAAKLVWNTNNWERPDGMLEIGVPVHGPHSDYNYGLEEFLFCQEQRASHKGYLDCYRRVGRDYGDPENVVLFSLCPAGNIMHIGNLFEVVQLHDGERVEIWNDFNQINFIANRVNPTFCEIEDLPLPNDAVGTQVFVENNFGMEEAQLPNIQATAPNGYFVNMRYREIRIFDMPVNLTEIDPIINDKWKKLSVRYIVENLPSPELIEYLRNSFR